MSQILQLEDIKLLKSCLFQQGYKLVSQAGCNVFIKITDCLGSQYYGSLGLLRKYTSGGLQLEPGDTVVDGISGLPVDQPEQSDTPTTQAESVFVPSFANVNKVTEEQCPVADEIPFIPSALHEAINSCGMTLDDDGEDQSIVAHPDTSFYNNFTMSEFDSVKEDNHSSRRCSPGQHEDNCNDSSQQIEQSDPIMTDVSEMCQKPSDYNISLSNKSLFPYMPGDDDGYDAILGDMMTPENQEELLVTSSGDKCTDTPVTEQGDNLAQQSCENADHSYVLQSQEAHNLRSVSEERHLGVSMPDTGDEVDGISQVQGACQKVYITETGDPPQGVNDSVEMLLQEPAADAPVISSGVTEVDEVQFLQDDTHEVDEVVVFNSVDVQGTITNDKTSETTEILGENSNPGGAQEEDVTPDDFANAILQEGTRVDFQKDIINIRVEENILSLTAEEPGSFSCQVKQPVECLSLVHSTVQEAGDAVKKSPTTNRKAKKFTCEKCNITYKRRQTLTKHNNIHHCTDPSQLLNCKLCSGMFRTTEALLQHRRIEHPESIKFSCKLCPAEFPDPDELRVHKATHVELKSLTCDVCNECFSARYILRNHREKQHPDAPPPPEVPEHSNEKFKFSCEICNKGYMHKSTLRRHVQSHMDEKHQCPFCDQSCLRRDKLNNHIQSKHPDSVQYQCIVCSATFENAKTLKEHRETHKADGKYKFKCDVCGKAFRDRVQRSEHIKEKHLNLSPKPVTCHLCGKQLKRDIYLPKHMELMHSTEPKVVEKKFMCFGCNKSFANQSMLKYHIRRLHSNERPFACSVCSKRFVKNTELVSHVRDVHTNPGNCTCQVCGKVLCSPQVLAKHVERVHGEKLSKCALCDKEFKNEFRLEVHMKNLHSERNYTCQYCGKKFATEKYLKMHEGIHTGKKDYKCDQCPYATNFESNLGLHKRVHAKPNSISQYGIRVAEVLDGEA